MAAEVLQQLRDIHLPEAPGVWPPAPGWWLLALLLLGALVWLTVRLVTAERKRRPIHRARHLYDELYRRHLSGEVSARDYLHQSNELIKRLLIHGLGDDSARRAHGPEWLALLDRHADEPAFTSGAGSALGDARFRPDVDADTAAVHEVVSRLLTRIRPRSEGGAR
jgi:hypothetical protein